MIRVFVDTSVFFAAIYSNKGYSYELFLLAADERVKLVISNQVQAEIVRNIIRKIPHKLPVYRVLMELIDFELASEPSPEELHQAALYVVKKDVPIVAAAKQAQVDYLVTFDERDLLKENVIAQSGLRIVKPEQVIKLLTE